MPTRNPVDRTAVDVSLIRVERSSRREIGPESATQSRRTRPMARQNGRIWDRVVCL